MTKKPPVPEASKHRKGRSAKRRDVEKMRQAIWDARKKSLEVFLSNPEAVAKTAEVLIPALSVIKDVLFRMVSKGAVPAKPATEATKQPDLILGLGVSPNDARRQLDQALLCLGTLQGDPERVRLVRSALMDLYGMQSDSESKLLREQAERRKSEEEWKETHLDVVTRLHEEREALVKELAEIKAMALCAVQGLEHQVPQSHQCEHEWCKSVRWLRAKLDPKFSKES